MKKQRVAGAGRNNYINKIYFSLDDVSISKSIDFITLSNIHPDYEKTIYDFLEKNGFIVVSDNKLLKGNFHMKRTYRHDHDIASVEILHDLKDSFCGYPTLLLSVHDLNKELLSSLDSFFKHHGLLPKVSQIELTMDLLTDDIVGLYEFLQSHLFMKNGRTILEKEYMTTFYLNNIRKSKSKGMKVYLNPKKGPKKSVRMEITLKRQLIKRLGLDITLNNVDSLDLKRFFDFRLLDDKSLLRHLIWQSRFHIERLEKKRTGRGNLVKRLIHDYLHTIIFGHEKELMRKTRGLKLEKDMVRQYNRFLKPLNDFNDSFFKMLSQSSFIPSRPMNLKKVGCKKSLGNAPKGQQTGGLFKYVLSKKPIVNNVKRGRLPSSEL
jgi:hypothetical protein